MTNHIILTNSWQQIAAGACLIETVKGVAKIHFGESSPAADTKAFHVIGGKKEPAISYPFAEKVFACCAGLETEIVVTEA